MTTEKTTYYESIRPFEQAVGREPTTSSDDDAGLLAPLVVPMLDHSDSAVTKIRARKNRLSITSLFHEKKTLLYLYNTYRMREGVSLFDAAKVGEVLSRTPFAPSKEEQPIQWEEHKAIWQVFTVLAEETILQNCIQTVNGNPWNPSNEARRGIEDASRHEWFRKAYRACRHSSTALGFTSGALDNWDFTVGTIQNEPLIRFLKEDLMVLLDDLHLEMLAKVIPHVPEYIYDTGVADLPLHDYHRVGINAAESEASAILSKIGAKDHSVVNGDINTHYTLYCSPVTIQLTHTLLLALDLEIVGRALRKTYQDTVECLPLAILAYGATLVELHVRKVLEIRRHNGADLRSTDLANRLSNKERIVLNNHGTCLHRLEREKLTSNKYPIVAQVVRDLVKGLDLKGVLKNS